MLALLFCRGPNGPPKLASNRHSRSWPYSAPRVAIHDHSHSSESYSSSPQAPTMDDFPSLTSFWGDNTTAVAMVKLLSHPAQSRPLETVRNSESSRKVNSVQTVCQSVEGFNADQHAMSIGSNRVKGKQKGPSGERTTPGASCTGQPRIQLRSSGV